ncbi:MAG: hypothetical protein ACM3MF_00630, partial [Anaerolineae bacterium]
LLILAAAMAAGWRTLNGDGDLPRHLVTGQVIVETRSIPRHDIFSYYYQGRTYVAHEWVADVIYYLFYKLLGLGGVVLLTAILIATTFFILYSAMVAEHNERFVTMGLLAWGVVCSYWHWVARPHLFTMLFLALWLVLVDRIARGQAVKLWLLPVLMLVWSNTHSAFIAGFLVLVAYMAGWVWDYVVERPAADPAVLKRLSFMFGLSFLASLVNPFGIETWGMMTSYVNNTALMSIINDTKPPVFTDPQVRSEFLLMLLSLLLLGMQRSGIRAGRAFLLVGTTALAMTSGRNIHLYAVVAPFVLAGPAIEVVGSGIKRRFAAATASVESQLRGVAWPVMTALACVALLAVGKIGKDYYFEPARFPVDAVTWLEDNPQSGRMFNDFDWGGYVVWRLWPEQADFIDGKSDLSGEATRDYLTVQDLGPGWQGILDRYDVRWAIIPTDSALSSRLIQDGWAVLYQDPTAVILRRN